MVRRKRELNSPVVLRISTVVLPETIDELPVFMRWAAERGLNQVIYHIDPTLSANERDARRVQQRIAEAYSVADQHPQLHVIALNEFDWFYAQRHNLKPVRDRSFFKVAPKPCAIAFDNLYVTYTGIVRPCCKSWFPLGNVIDDPIETVWNSRQAYVFRRRMLNLDFRDCVISCDLNAKPIDHRMSLARKAYWVVRRDPRVAFSKAKRKLGFTNAQLDLPVLNRES